MLNLFFYESDTAFFFVTFEYKTSYQYMSKFTVRKLHTADLKTFTRTSWYFDFTYTLAEGRTGNEEYLFWRPFFINMNLYTDFYNFYVNTLLL